MSQILQLILVLYLLWPSSVRAYTTHDLCDHWQYQMDTTNNVDFALSTCQDIFPKVSPDCQARVYVMFGEIYLLKLQPDSALYFFDQAIDLAKKLADEEQLMDTYFRKAGVLIEDKGKTNSGIALLNETRKLLDKYPDSKAWIGYYNRMASLADEQADYQKAIVFTDSTLAVATRFRDSLEIPPCYHNLGVYYMKLADYEKAAENLLHALAIREKTNDDLAVNYYVLGFCYNKWKQYETGRHYLRKGVAQSRKDDNGFHLLLNYIAQANADRHLANPDDAVVAVDSAILLARKLDSPYNISEALRMKARIYFEDYQLHERAETYFQQAYDAAVLADDPLVLYPSCLGMIQFFLQQKQYAKAEKFFPQLEDLTRQMQRADYKVAFHKVYSQYLEGIGNAKEALSHFRKFHLLQDSIANKEVYGKVAALEKKYDTKQKELDIVRLQREKEAQAQLAATARFRQYFFLGVAVLLLSLILVGSWFFRKLQVQKEALREAHQNLEELNGIKDRLFSIVAHDLRGMIIPFQRAGRILKHYIDKGNYQQTIRLSAELQKNSQQLSQMLDNLLQWSLDQMNGYSHKPVPISVQQELAEIVSIFEQQSMYKNVEISLQVAAGEIIDFDKGAFHVIFRNLIANALKFTENGRIDIIGRRAAGKFIFKVKDSGTGMSKEQVAHIFDLGKTVTTTGTKGEKGSGLGLSLVHRFVEIHAGEIMVSSEEGMGSEFELVFPLAAINATDDKVLSQWSKSKAIA